MSTQVSEYGWVHWWLLILWWTQAYKHTLVLPFMWAMKNIPRFPIPWNTAWLRTEIPCSWIYQCQTMVFPTSHWRSPHIHSTLRTEVLQKAPPRRRTAVRSNKAKTQKPWYVLMGNGSYPLANKHGYWKWPIYSWFTYFRWWFSIAECNGNGFSILKYSWDIRNMNDQLVCRCHQLRGWTIFVLNGGLSLGKSAIDGLFSVAVMARNTSYK